MSRAKKLLESAYSDFIANGGKDSDWEEYAAKKNTESRQRNKQALLDKWHNGSELNGNDIANHLRSINVSIPSNIQRILQDDDTVVDKSAVTARGISRSEAKKVLDFVLSHMA